MICATFVLDLDLSHGNALRRTQLHKVSANQNSELCETNYHSMIIAFDFQPCFYRRVDVMSNDLKTFPPLHHQLHTFNCLLLIITYSKLLICVQHEGSSLLLIQLVSIKAWVCG